MQLAPGLHRLGDGLVNAYLLADGGAVTIVDAGVPGYWGDLPGRARGDGPHHRRRPRDRPDPRPLGPHRLRRARPAGARLAGPRPRARCGAGPWRGAQPGQGPRADQDRAAAVVPVVRGAPWRAAHDASSRRSRPSATGRRSTSPGRPQVILVPGHTPGSAALHVPSHDALFVGDAMATKAVTTGATGPMIAPFTADPDEARRSLDRLRGIEAALAPARPRPALDRRRRRGGRPRSSADRSAASATRFRGQAVDDHAGNRDLARNSWISPLPRPGCGPV